MTLHLVCGFIQFFRWSKILLTFQTPKIGCRIAHHFARQRFPRRFACLIAQWLVLLLVRGFTPFIRLSMTLLMLHLP